MVGVGASVGRAQSKHQVFSPIWPAVELPVHVVKASEANAVRLVVELVAVIDKSHRSVVELLKTHRLVEMWLLLFSHNCDYEMFVVA